MTEEQGTPKLPESADEAPLRHVVGRDSMRTEPCGVCQKPTNPWKLIESGEIGRCPACAQSLETERKGRRRTQVLVASIVILFVVVAGAAAGFSYLRYRSSPAYSLDQLQDAMSGGSTIVTRTYLDDSTVADELVAAYESTDIDTADVDARERVRSAIGNVPLALAANGFIDGSDDSRAEVVTLIPSRLGSGVFYVELRLLMEPAKADGEDVWRITHALNAEEFINSLVTGVPNSDLASSISD